MRAFVGIMWIVAILVAVEPSPIQQSLELDEWHGMSSAAAKAAKEMIVDADSDPVPVIAPKKVRRVIAADHGDTPVDEEQERQEKRLFSPHRHIVISGVGGGERSDRIERDLFTALLRHKGQYKFGIDGGEDGDDGGDTDDTSEQ